MPGLRPSKSPLSRGQRLLILGAIAALMVGYSAWGVVRDDFVIPEFWYRRHHHGYAHFHGAWALAAAAALTCIALAAVVLIVEDHRAPAGRKASHTRSTLLSGVGFAVFVVLVTLRQFGAI